MCLGEDFKTWDFHCTINFGEREKGFLLPVGIISSVKDLGLTQLNYHELKNWQLYLEDRLTD